MKPGGQRRRGEGQCFAPAESRVMHGLCCDHLPMKADETKARFSAIKGKFAR
jgi:hypothetical protein